MKYPKILLFFNYVIIATLIALASVLFFYSQVDYQSHQARIEKVRLLQQETTYLIRNTLLVQSGESAHFDYITKSEKSINSKLKKTDISYDQVNNFILAIKETLVTASQIKSIFAIYRNSLLFFPKGVELLRSELNNVKTKSLLVKLYNFERAVLQFNVATSNKQKKTILITQIESLRLEASELPESLNKRINQLLRHTNVLIDYSLHLQILNRQLLTNDVSKSSQQLIDLYQELSQQDVYQASRVKDGFFFTILLLIIFVTYLWWKQQKGMVIELQDRAEKLILMAHYDMLTRLPNRTLFADRFKLAMANAKRKNNILAICFIDLDNFKPVNDNFGHDIGDSLLIEVAERITANIRIEDTVSRQGGDEFTLLLRDIESIDKCEQRLERIRHALAQPYLIKEHTLNISISLGATLYPNDDTDLDTLIRHADQAMYQAKIAGKNQLHLFDATDVQKTIQKLSKLQEIKQALADKHFCLYYQPKVNMMTGKVFGVEALIRWIHPDKGLIPPLDFLPNIEGTDLEIQIGGWVINEAFQQLNTWQQHDIKLEVSINISSHHLQSPTFFDQLNDALDRYPSIDSQDIQLEILESSALSNINNISGIIKSCQNVLGVNVALDDFGTGYSSLTHIKNLSANIIKIDQTFVRDLLDDPSDYRIIDGVIGLADAFNRKVIAEGVETTVQGLVLLIMGCQEAQGYGISKPMPANDIASWLNDYIPNQEWINHYDKDYTEQENTIKLLLLITEHWFKNTNEIILTMEDKNPRELSFQHHSKEWLSLFEQKNIFDEQWMKNLKESYDMMCSVAKDLINIHQTGEIDTAKKGLIEVEINYVKVRAILEQFEKCFQQH